MSIDTWGDKPKSQTDNTLIDDEIDALIQAHKDDPDAHLETGQSLQSHKASEIIDHLARSVVRDKLSFDRFTIDEHFSTIDAWQKSATVSLNTLGQVNIQTLSVTNNVQYLYANPGDAMPDGGSAYAFPTWLARVKLGQITNQLAYFGQFDLDIPFGVGFKVSNGSLYAFYINSGDVEQTISIAGITLDDTWHNYRFEITAGYNISWYIDDVLVASVVGVTLEISQMFAYFYLKTTANVSKIMYVQVFHYDEDYTA